MLHIIDDEAQFDANLGRQVRERCCLFFSRPTGPVRKGAWAGGGTPLSPKRRTPAGRTCWCWLGLDSCARAQVHVVALRLVRRVRLYCGSLQARPSGLSVGRLGRPCDKPFPNPAPNPRCWWACCGCHPRTCTARRVPTAWPRASSACASSARCGSSMTGPSSCTTDAGPTKGALRMERRNRRSSWPSGAADGLWTAGTCAAWERIGSEVGLTD